MRRPNALCILAACGTALAAGSSANAQYLINISGATLLENFLVAPASTNDYYGVDGDGCHRNLPSPCLDQLAPFALPPNPNKDFQTWIVQYRSIGSVNGLQELIDFGQTFVTTVDGVDIDSTTTSGAYHQGILYLEKGVPVNNIFNSGNPGGVPVRSTAPAGFNQLPKASYTPPNQPSPGGYRSDLAPVDVPTRWAVQEPGPDPEFDLTPGLPGYGQNPAVSLNKDGTVNGFDHLLANRGNLNIFDPMVTPDNNTIFDTTLTVSPVAALTNFGTGLTQLRKTAQRHSLATGRLDTGINYHQHTRDSGSGTRNAFTNSCCLDASWGIGENVHPDGEPGPSVAPEQEVIGPFWNPSNKGGSSRLESTLIDCRLGIGYSGAERGIGKWLDGGTLDILAIRNDFPFEGGVTYNRPTAENCINFTPEDGYIIAGPSVIASIGDPKNENHNGGVAGNTNPLMRNDAAAAYLNNITRSITAFAGAPGVPETEFTPAEFLADRFIPVAAPDRLQLDFDPCASEPNTDQVPVLRQFVLDNSKLGDPGYQQFGFYSQDGRVPTRFVGTNMGSPVTYTDEGLGSGANEVVNGNQYINEGGIGVQYGTPLDSRNRIAGDFDGDAVRDSRDVPDMMAAWWERNGGPDWVAPDGQAGSPIAGEPGTDFVIEIVGDFTADGNFDKDDIYYWADGLHNEFSVSSGAGGVEEALLDRCAGFLAVDTAWNALLVGEGMMPDADGFFDVALANPNATYDPGDAVADVSNADALHTPGFNFIGADGVVDDHDLDYVFAQFKQNPRVLDGELNWSETAEAIGGDLSADINGDLVINMDDINKILSILETSQGDVNLDGVCDAADCAAVVLGGSGWAEGDVNGDGVVDQADLDIVSACAFSPCDGDANGDGNVDSGDISFIIFRLGDSGASCVEGDANGDGVVNSGDISYVIFRLGTCSPGGPCGNCP